MTNQIGLKSTTKIYVRALRFARPLAETGLEYLIACSTSFSKSSLIGPNGLGFVLFFAGLMVFMNDGGALGAARRVGLIDRKP